MKILTTALRVTEAHRAHKGAHPAERESACIRAMFPDFLGEIRDDDVCAGRIDWPLAGFRAWSEPGFLGYYCDFNKIASLFKKDDLSADNKEALKELLLYWKDNSTTNQIRAADTGELAAEQQNAVHWTSGLNTEGGSVLPHAISYAYRASGINLNFKKLLSCGIPGILSEINKEAAQHEEEKEFFDGLRTAIDLIKEACFFYAEQARVKLANTTDPKRKSDLEQMVNALDAIAIRPPATLREAIQLFWLYSRIASIENFGRMDDYLGSFYERDLELGILDKASAGELLLGLWRQIARDTPVFSGRIIIGGLGRSDEKAADLFAELALETSRKMGGLLPQLSLRWHGGLKESLLAKSLDALGDGQVLPMLHNDTALIPAIQSAFGFTAKEAEQYVMSDCGEFGVEHASIGFPDGNLIMTRALELALFNGKEPTSGIKMGLETGRVESFKTFDKLWEAYARQTEYLVSNLMDRFLPFYPVMQRDASYLWMSALMDDCIASGAGLIDGIRYKGILVEIYGTINTADSLAAIKHVVYERGCFDLAYLLKMLKANFVGYEKERKLLVNAPKFGNDDEFADEMAVKVYRHICEEVRKHKDRLNLDFCMADLINAHGHVSCGRKTGALPDGRLAGEPFANANNPSNGNDSKGLSALLNSLVKLKPDAIGGQVQNLKLSRDLFHESRAKLEAALRVYFAKGGSQVMITSVSRDDLENAMKEPDKYRHIIVRVGGFCAKFVTLEKDVQEEIAARLLQE